VSHPFRVAVEARDRAAMVACLTPDAVFHSPVAHRPFAGAEALDALFAALLDVFEDFRYTDELTGDGLVALIFAASVGGRALHGVDLLRTDADGLVSELTVMVRPLSGLVALAEAMAPRVNGLAKVTPPA
jgi:hypothetical protein